MRYGYKCRLVGTAYAKFEVRIPEMPFNSQKVTILPPDSISHVI